jgi:multicomponent Na+:H+ antiporter subunit B
MKLKLRTLFVWASGCAILSLLAWGMSGLPDLGNYPGPYGDILNAAAPKERHVNNVVTAVNFDFRGFDTLGEEFILFSSVAGVILLMRHEAGREDDRPGSATPAIGPNEEQVDAYPSELTRAAGLVFVGMIFLFGSYVVLTGHLSVGGGFQGGVLLSGAWLLAFLVFGSKAFHRFSRPSMVEGIGAAGAACYVIIGILALLLGKSFLTNIFPLGQRGQLLSSGGIFLINLAVGVEVTAGFILLLKEFLRPLEKEKPLRRP